MNIKSTLFERMRTMMLSKVESKRETDLILELPIKDEAKSQLNLNKDSEMPLFEFKILSRFLNKWKITIAENESGHWTGD